jgi:hypothetical protein
MTIRCILLCWLCNKPFDVPVDLFAGTQLGNPRFWCRHCTSPRFFSKRLRERIARNALCAEEGAGLFDALNKLLVLEQSIEEARAETLAA